MGKKEQNMQLFYFKKVSFLEGEICALTNCEKGNIVLRKWIIPCSVLMEWAEFEMTFSNFDIGEGVERSITTTSASPLENLVQTDKWIA